MKKQFLSIVAATALLVTAAMPAQAQIKFGVKGGLNFTSPSEISNLSEISSVNDISLEGSTGWFIGPMAEFTIPIVGLGVDASLLYSKADNKLKAADNNHTVKKTLKQQYIDLPINLKYSIGLGSIASVFVAAGPQFSYDISGDDFEDILEDAIGNGMDDDDIKSSSLRTSINVAVGAKLLKHLQVSLGYNIALSDGYTIKSIGNQAFNGGSKNNMFKAAVAVTF